MLKEKEIKIPCSLAPSSLDTAVLNPYRVSLQEHNIPQSLLLKSEQEHEMFYEKEQK